MDSKNKVEQLKNNIKQQLSSLINKDYVYLDLPYHNNIGDSLIWKGTLSFLKHIPFKCLYSTNYSNYQDKRMDSFSLILFHGGGNFGDLYPLLNEFRKKVIAAHPKQEILILPQTVFYKEKSHLLEDADFYNKYSNITICARDKLSYSILRQYFVNNRILLVPDMAFCINLNTDTDKRTGRVLYLKRNDIERININTSLFPRNVEIHDWPVLEKEPLLNKSCRYLSMIFEKSDSILKLHLSALLEDFLWKKILKSYNIKRGIDFLSSYDKIYTSRLHVAILGILLNKPRIYLLDNNYGKLRSFYETWLSDLDSVEYLVND